LATKLYENMRFHCIIRQELQLKDRFHCIIRQEVKIKRTDFISLYMENENKFVSFSLPHAMKKNEEK
jgi:hypothetical protein